MNSNASTLNSNAAGEVKEMAPAPNNSQGPHLKYS